MRLRSVCFAIAAIFLPSAALAQAWIPTSEVEGLPLQVTTNGITNTVYLDKGGLARIVTPGGRTISASWTAASGRLCLNTGAASECWPYAAPFQANQPVTLVSSCLSSSTWLAQSVNSIPPPASGQRGERGR